jgi:chromosome segregation ATPase
MSTLVLGAIIAVDILLIAGMYILLRNQRGTDLAVSDLTAERELISNLQSTIKRDISTTNAEQKTMMSKLSKIAAEIEQEVSTQKSGITENLDEITSELAKEFETPLRELTRKQNALEALYKRLKHERSEVEKATSKAAQLTKFFNEKVPYEDILSELEDKKYMDARRLLSKGLSTDEVSSRLGLPIAEIEVMGNISRF